MQKEIVKADQGSFDGKTCRRLREKRGRDANQRGLQANAESDRMKLTVGGEAEKVRLLAKAEAERT